jgi:F0F1-type ATP synthase delta subunit
MVSLIDRYVGDLVDYAAEHGQMENYYRAVVLLLRGSDIDGTLPIPDELYSFLKLLPDDDANAVTLRFLEEAGERLGMLDVKIFSSAPLTFSQWTDIEDKLAEKFGKKISLVMKIDRSLIGGLRIAIGEHIVIDNTVKTRITEMKKNIYKEVYLK